MSQQIMGGSGNLVTVDDQDRIVVVFRGPQNRLTLEKVQNQLQQFVEKMHLSGKKANILIDAQGVTTADTDSGARTQARTLLNEVPFDKFAICGKRSIVILASYIVRFSSKGRRVQFFSNRQKAEQWLLKKESHQARQSSISLTAGIIIAAIGALGLVGWQFNNIYLMSWIPGLRPINPMSALALILLGAGFMIYSAKKLRQLRWAGGFGIVMGIITLLPIPIDTLLYGDRVAALGSHALIADSAAICFIAAGLVALVANRTGWRWRRTLEMIIACIIGGIGLINVFGQLYARDWLYALHPHFAMSFNLAIAFIIAAITLIVMVMYSRVGVNSLARVSRASILIVVVLVLSQAATYGAWLQAVGRNNRDAEVAFRNDSNTIKRTMEDRFTAYNNLLYGFQGLFLSSAAVSQSEFESYYQATNVAKNYPGLETLSFISKVDTKGLPAFVQSIRNDTSLRPVGNPTFTITQQSDQNDHYILTYIANSFAIGGADFSSNSARLQAFKQAEAQKRPIASGTVTFAPTLKTATQNGFFISVPVARQQEPTKVIGFVNAVFSYSKFFSDVFSKTNLQPDMSVHILDKTDGRTISDLTNNNGNSILFREEIPISVANRTWLLSVASTGRFAASSRSLPRAVFFAGQTFSLLLVIIFLMQAKGRKAALDLADEVTEDLQQERNLAVARDQQNRTILSSIGDGIFAVDIHRVITLFNPAAETISGRQEIDAIGQPYAAILRFQFERTGKINDGFIKKALEGHTVSNPRHTILIHKDGSYVPVSISAAPIRDIKNNITGAIIVFRDVTKEYEFDKAKSEFVSLTSHQLRTPLSAINWYAEMLVKGEAGKLTKVQSAYMNEILIGSNRMNDLVNALLNASRLEIGKLSTKPEPTDVGIIISNLEKELEVMIRDKEQTLRTHINPVPNVDADPKQLRMIVQNLMSNAVKYTPQKGIIDVTLRPAKEDDMARAGFKHRTGEYWLFCIQDTGYGIPKEDQSKIFGKLFRAENARTLNVEGTGLGLFIVKQVVDKIGGKVWFESMETVGTIFYVVAPINPKHGKDDVYNKTQEEE